MQANKKSHTTSTKCQYQAAASKPKWRGGGNWPALARDRQTRRKRGPVMKGKPRKPRRKKKGGAIDGLEVARARRQHRMRRIGEGRQRQIVEAEGEGRM